MSSYRQIIQAETSATLKWFVELGETVGSTTITDAGGVGLVGTLSNGPVLGVTGLPAGDGITACSFDGVDDQISIADVAASDVGDNYCQEFWIKRAGGLGTTQDIFMRNAGYDVRLTTSDFIQGQFFGTGAFMTSTTPITDLTTWHHVVVNKSPGAASIYIDGQSVGGGYTNRVVTDNNNAVFLGRSSAASNPFNGKLTRVALYSGNLSADRIMVHYKAGLRELGVPDVFDLLINGEGYLYYDPWTGGDSVNAPAKATMSLTPTFIPRQNTQGNYGDNQQDFWLTYSQNDWSLGETQRFQGRDDAGKRKYWSGSSINNRVQGQVSLQKASASTTASGNLLSISARGSSVNENLVFVTSTNLYELASDGTITDRGAHGAGSSGALRGAIISDGTDVYIGGATAIRKWDGAAFSTFSVNSADSIIYHNNTLYGLGNSSGNLYSWDSGGTRTSLFQWKQVDTGGRSGQGRLLSWGSKIVISWSLADKTTELWLYDGTGVSKIASLPSNFFAHDMCELAGVLFVAGGYWRSASTTTYNFKPAVWYYANGTSGELWKATDYISSTSSQLTNNGTGITVLDGGIIWNDSYSGSLMFYDLGTGSVSSVATGIATNQAYLADSSSTFTAFSASSTTLRYYPNNATTASSGTITSSLIDFDLSLNKVFRGIKVDFTSATDGDGGSVDIAYRVGDVDGSYTTLQTGATSGQEYTLSNVSGRSISVRITLNKGTSTAGPVLKRLYVRAIPVQAAYRRQEYVINCTGRDGKQNIALRNGRPHPKDGLTMAQALKTAATASAPIYIYDELGGYTGIIEGDTFQLYRIHPEEYVCRFIAREV